MKNILANHIGTIFVGIMSIVGIYMILEAIFTWLN